ncbi:predicted protein [Naegleria gruberi]|uniref:Predicted protein n=1 Tax=Naegleria gruberi TaxID=5762 RepID=D2V072_NAEGR|nr:uncharacterized protein NAEGRDRAFT_29881 [Naegleria gruberi]EFC49665.1 predicted protein [Naegleria gruberi]|eukprot:XP_002682409.1 predicted protein [Naegleria gruberi strain NEG-M]
MLQVSLGRSISDAWLIILQILLIQLMNYFLLVLMCVVVDLPFGYVPTLEQIFSYKAISVFSLFGWISIGIWVLDGFVGGFLLFMIVRRSKKCMDFTITFHVIHLIFCIIYKAFPVYWEWYVFIVLHGIIMTLVGEFSCYWREQREINLPATSKLTSSSKHSSSAKLNQPTQGRRRG